eukprot:3694100-Ditylum_brightwellii.AAC.1
METKTWRSCAEYLGRVANILDGGEEKYKLDLPLPDEDAGGLMGGVVLPEGAGKMKAAAKAGGGAMAAVAADEKLINPHTGETETADERAERIRIETEEKMSPEELHTIRVPGSLALFLTRLDEEYNK